MAVPTWRHAGVTLAAAAALAGCSGGSSGSDGGSADGGKAASDSAATVHMKLLQYKPVELTVKAGTEVRFVNDEPITHTVTTGSYTVGDQGFRATENKDGRLDKTLKGKGDAVTYTFAEPGTYQYFCTIHKAMQASVVVQ